MRYDVKDLKKAGEGKQRIEWAAKEMPVLNMLKEEFKKKKPLNNITVGCCLHVTSETANLAIAMKRGGANVYLCASNPLSTQDDVAASLVKDYGISVFAIKGEDNKTYYKHLKQVISQAPHITMDDGADLVSEILKKHRGLLKRIIGGSEETTTGVIRLKAMERDKVLGYPIIAVNDAQTKHFFDNRYGTGQSTLDGILRATNILYAGKTFVVCGYGWCGRGVAMRARGMGARVVVTEVDPLKALEATMDGFGVMSIKKAAIVGDIFVTVTGDIDVISRQHFLLMKDGAIVANSGHFNVEIDIPGLKSLSKKVKSVKPFVNEYTLKNNNRVYLLGEGRLINLAAAEGHPASVMDMSFANQALSAKYIVQNSKKLENKVYPVPRDIDEHIALMKLRSMGIEIDQLTPKQEKYLSSWQEGT
ncbi:MAG: adenosylhomocysteinase [bacterium]